MAKKKKSKKKLVKRLDLLECAIAEMQIQLSREEQFETWKATSSIHGGEFGFGQWWQSEEATGPKELT